MDDLKKESCYESIGSKTIVEKFQQYEQYEWWNYGTKFREEEEHRHGRENVFLCSMKKTMEGEGKEIVGWHVSRFILVISNGIFANVELEIHYFFVAIQNLINNKTLFKKAKILNIHMQHYHKNYNGFAETHKKRPNKSNVIQFWTSIIRQIFLIHGWKNHDITMSLLLLIRTSETVVFERV